MKSCLDIRKHFADITDLSNERKYWLDLTDYDVAKVLRYLMEFSNFAEPHKREVIMNYLNGFMSDIVNDTDNDHFERWCV